jgi:hypothetical protein
MVAQLFGRVKRGKAVCKLESRLYQNNCSVRDFEGVLE